MAKYTFLNTTNVWVASGRFTASYANNATLTTNPIKYELINKTLQYDKLDATIIPELEIMDEWGNWVKDTFTLSDDGFSFIYEQDGTRDIRLITPVRTLGKYSVYTTGKLTNCSANYNDGDWLEANKRLIITADEGYILPTGSVANFQINYTNSKIGEATVATMSYSNGNKTAEINTAVVTSEIGAYSMRMNWVAIEQPIERMDYQTFGFTHASCNYADKEVIKADKLDIVITADNGFYFPLVSGYKIGTKTLAGSAWGETTLTLYDGDGNAITDSSSQYGTVLKVTLPSVLMVRFLNNFVAKEQTIVNRFHSDYTVFVNCSCNYSDMEELSNDKNVIVTPIDGYAFITESMHLTTGEGELITMVLNDDGQFFLDMSGYPVDEQYRDLYTVESEVKATPIPIESPTPFVNVFLPTQNELLQLSNIVMAEENFNLNSYIHKLYLSPFPFSKDDCFEDKQFIKLGYDETTVKAYKMLFYKRSYDLGSIGVPLKYNNAYDFTSTECKLFLPYIGEITLPNEFVIGGNIAITYTVDLYDGTCDVFVRSDLASDEVIFNTTKIVMTDVPLVTKAYEVQGSYNNGFSNEVVSPYVIVTRNIPMDSELNDEFGYKCNITDKLSNFDGYIEVDTIHLETSATRDEINDIEALLKKGVIV